MKDIVGTVAGERLCKNTIDPSRDVDCPLCLLTVAEEAMLGAFDRTVVIVSLPWTIGVKADEIVAKVKPSRTRGADEVGSWSRNGIRLGRHFC